MVWAIRDERETRDAPQRERHRPSTEEERIAAGIALDFARALQRGDGEAACAFAAGAMARALRCRTASVRVPDELRIEPEQHLAVVDARLRADTANMEIPAEPGPVYRLAMRRLGLNWRVTAVEVFAYAAATVSALLPDEGTHAWHPAPRRRPRWRS